MSVVKSAIATRKMDAAAHGDSLRPRRELSPKRRSLRGSDESVEEALAEHASRTHERAKAGANGADRLAVSVLRCRVLDVTRESRRLVFDSPTRCVPLDLSPLGARIYRESAMTPPGGAP